MTTVTIPLSAISIQNPKASTRYGSVARLPLSPTESVLSRAALSNIPAGAIVSSALIQFWQHKAGTGSVSLLAKANTAPFSTRSTWASRPATSATNQATQARTAPSERSVWSLDVTALTQSWVSGALVNNGVTITTTSATAGKLRGQTASDLRPVLVVTYSTSPLAPTALHPTGGAVSKAKPTLTFQVPANTIAVQARVDPAANATTPAFDTGEVTSSAGLIDLSRTDLPGGIYPDLADGASTQFQARVKNALGWGPWAAWVGFSRAAWGTLTITSPTPVSEDPSPVIQATYSGTVTSWQALTRNASATVANDSTWTPGASISYGTTKSVGASGSAVVRVRDNVVRVATPGDPDYLEASVSFTVSPSGTPAVLTNVRVTQQSPRPWVTLMAERAQVPDEVAIYRNDLLVGRVSGVGSFVGGFFTFVDYTAPMNVPATYSLRAVVNGAFSNATSATATPRCQGIWFVDPDDGSDVVLWGGESQGQTQPELAVEHTPVDPSKGIVRRRLARYPRQGEFGGLLTDALDVSAEKCEATLRAWVAQDAGHVYRLVLGNQNDPVIIGNVEFGEVAENGDERFVKVAGDWWWQG